MKKYIGLEEMSNVNCASVLNVIRNCGEVSRKQITDITGLSWGGMTKIVNRLFENGYIEEDKSEKAVGHGRTPNVIRICKDKHYVIGLDVNREGVIAHVMNLAGETVKEHISEISAVNKEQLLKSILDFVRDIVNEFKDKKILAIGMAMQGVLDAERGVSVKFPYCPDWNHVPLKDIMEEEFGIEVFLEHDPNCMLYSSLYEEESDNMLLLRMGGSVGMAASIGGEIIRGTGLLEVAHTVVVPGGKDCKCGQKGCLEAYVGSCFEHKEFRPQAIPDMLEPLSVFMSNMVRIFNSDMIIITGRLARHHAFYEKELLDQFYQYCEGKVKIKFLEGTERAVHGAALIAVQGAIDKLKMGL